MTATADRRHEMIERMADFVLAQGLTAASLRPLAASAGTSDRMLLYYFKDKAQAIDAVLDCVARRLSAALADRTQPRPMPIGRLRGKLLPVLLDGDLWPHMRLWLEISSLAAWGDAVPRDRAQAIWHILHDWVNGQLVNDDPNQKARLMMMIQSAIQQKAIGLRDARADGQTEHAAD